MSEKVSTTQKRLHEMMQALNISQQDIANRTGLNKSTISNYCNGNRTPNQRNTAIISDAFQISPAWLMGFNTPMYVVDPNSSAMNKIKDITDAFYNYEISDSDRVIIIEANKLNRAGKQALKQYLDLLLLNKDYRKEDN